MSFILPRLGGDCRLFSSCWVASSLSATFIVASFSLVISMVARSPFLSPIFSFTSRGMYILSLWYLVSFNLVSYPKDWVIIWVTVIISRFIYVYSYVYV